ncbi:glutathione S-transferase [Zychaea mexicana]|uniref:glutathione S-transferase n=1 Tax=Zychaea mexicana TaxID=64656 RepID=UPI0022FEF325|nr:glutathione S-transferase [Zychaea mexicana]KAI9497215.1 glutathione S-transferase [Zychaea mexicana]
MSSSESNKIIFYAAAGCPFVQRAEIAFKEIDLEHERVEIDLANKPSWYKNINPETKVPAVTVAGKNIAESLIIIELANDLKSEKGLMPDDPTKRAQIRFAIEHYSSKIISTWANYMRNFKDGDRQSYIDTLEAAYSRLNELLLEQAPSGPYFLGTEYSLADIAIAPFVARIAAINYAFMDGLELEAVKTHSRLQEFIKGCTSRPSFQETYTGDNAFVEGVKAKLGLQ